MNREATDRYIYLTHDQYEKHCGARLGGNIQGIFTDEPHRGGLFTSHESKTDGVTSGIHHIPWTPKLPKEYKKAYGEDLTAELPKIFLRENGERVNDAKWQYCDLVQTLFLKNFAQPQYDWCTKHNMIYTGHVLHENSFSNQVTMQGSLMRFYEYQHNPGVDMLTEHDNSYWVVKQLSSAARPVGQKMAAVGTVRLHRLAVQLCEPQGRRRLAGAVRHQRALSPPVVVHDGRRGRTGLPGQHLLPIPLVERI